MGTITTMWEWEWSALGSLTYQPDLSSPQGHNKCFYSYTSVTEKQKSEKWSTSRMVAILLDKSDCLLITIPELCVGIVKFKHLHHVDVERF